MKSKVVGYLPVTRNLRHAYGSTLLGAALMAALSLGGLLYPSIFYPTEELLQSFGPNDIVNLVLGFPILLGSMWLVRHGKLIGLLCWPGALLYVLYNYIAYMFGIPLSLLTFAYLVLVLLSMYGVFDLLNGIDKNAVHEQLSGSVPVRAAGGILMMFGILFVFRAIGMIIEMITGQTVLPSSEIGVMIADIVISIFFITGGALLLRRSSLGYVSGLGFLFGASMLFIGLIMVLLLQPMLMGIPFSLIDVIVVFIMGLVCFIPFGLFVRKVAAIQI
jgi:hypothetical protein